MNECRTVSWQPSGYLHLVYIITFWWWEWFSWSVLSGMDGEWSFQNTSHVIYCKMVVRDTQNIGYVYIQRFMLLLSAFDISECIATNLYTMIIFQLQFKVITNGINTFKKNFRTMILNMFLNNAYITRGWYLQTISKQNGCVRSETIIEINAPNVCHFKQWFAISTIVTLQTADQFSITWAIVQTS